MSTTDNVRYPYIEVDLLGVEGNAFNILIIVRKALVEHGVPKEEIEEYLTEAMSSDYDHLLFTTFKWVSLLSDY